MNFPFFCMCMYENTLSLGCEKSLVRYAEQRRKTLSRGLFQIICLCAVRREMLLHEPAPTKRNRSDSCTPNCDACFHESALINNEFAPTKVLQTTKTRVNQVEMPLFFLCVCFYVLCFVFDV
jgi:hypothetical protein